MVDPVMVWESVKLVLQTTFGQAGQASKKGRHRTFIVVSLHALVMYMQSSSVWHPSGRKVIYYL